MNVQIRSDLKENDDEFSEGKTQRNLKKLKEISKKTQGIWRKTQGNFRKTQEIANFQLELAAEKCPKKACVFARSQKLVLVPWPKPQLGEQGKKGKLELVAIIPAAPPTAPSGSFSPPFILLNWSLVDSSWA